MMKVIATPRSFAKHNRAEIDALFQEHGIELEYNPFGGILTKEQMQEVLKDKDGIIVGIDPMPKEVMESAPKLKAIAKYGVGIDNIDTTYTDAKGIKVSRTVGANSNAVADYAFALLMDLARKVTEINNGCKAGNWGKTVTVDVYGKKIGVLGLGAIGRGVVKRAQGFDMQVYAFDAFKDDNYIKEHDIIFTDVDTIIKECDFISVHVPLLPETKHLLNRGNLKNAKPNLILINTARGGIVDEDALYDLCKEKKILGAGVDAFEHEPAEHSKLLELDNVIVGSHTAASTIGATEMMSLMAAQNVIQDLEG